ncbi:MAG: DNA cytosine methyltransferase [Clostridiales bacterium]|jgi:DNA (cytosine-5)-methyltransferase 1|nr:DNA cytosine methyltransferase [Clostridiales bacterium]
MKVVSLFSGAGGLDLGFKMAGHEIIWANDIYEDAAETYKANIGPHMVCKSIFDVADSDVPECGIVIGGFPCQGFSVANTKRSVDDGRNQLYKELVRVIRAKKPKYFVAENVKGICSLAKGEVLKLILEDFSSLGYKVQARILNAANYGVPQVRQRVFIVGASVEAGASYEYPAPTHSADGSGGLPKWIGVGEALSGLPDPDLPNAVSNHSYSKYKLRFNGYIGHREIDPLKPAPTVTARGDDKGGVVVLHHPSNQRRMSCRELATVQSFPLDYEFHGTRSSVYRQIGNAVPPLLAYAVARQIK